MKESVKEATQMAAATGAGAAVGLATVEVAGLTAAGMVGSGAGIGAAAGPVGLVAGALVGATAYSVYRIGWRVCRDFGVVSAETWAVEVQELPDNSLRARRIAELEAITRSLEAGSEAEE